jgi:hypothetical protein
VSLDVSSASRQTVEREQSALRGAANCNACNACKAVNVCTAEIAPLPLIVISGPWRPGGDEQPGRTHPVYWRNGLSNVYGARPRKKGLRHGRHRNIPLVGVHARLRVHAMTWPE